MLAKGYVGTVTLIGAAATAACVLAVLATNPLSIGPFGVTFWFIGMLAALSSWLSLAAYYLGNRLNPNRKTSQQIAGSWRRGLFAGGYITVLVALSSLRQLNLRDAVLLAILLALVEFYLVARS